MRARLTNTDPQPDDVIQGTSVVEEFNVSPDATAFVYEAQNYRIIRITPVTDGSADFEAEVERDRSPE